MFRSTWNTTALGTWLIGKMVGIKSFLSFGELLNADVSLSSEIFVDFQTLWNKLSQYQWKTQIKLILSKLRYGRQVKPS